VGMHEGEDVASRREIADVWRRSVVYMLVVGGVHFLAVPAVILVGEQRRLQVVCRGRLAAISGGVLLLTGAALALVSGRYLVTRGLGTPFPLEPTRQLVSTGPYRHVRNPQAMAATLIVMGQVVALRSRWLWILVPLTLLYLEGLARPLEDREMRQRFGEGYARYERTVPRWIPRWGRRGLPTG